VHVVVCLTGLMFVRAGGGEKKDIKKFLDTAPPPPPGIKFYEQF